MEQAIITFTADPKRLAHKRVTSVAELVDLGIERDNALVRHCNMLGYVDLLMFVDLSVLDQSVVEAQAAIAEALDRRMIGNVMIDAYGLAPKQQALIYLKLVDALIVSLPRYWFQIID